MVPTTCIATIVRQTAPRRQLQAELTVWKEGIAALPAGELKNRLDPWVASVQRDLRQFESIDIVRQRAMQSVTVILGNGTLVAMQNGTYAAANEVRKTLRALRMEVLAQTLLERRERLQRAATLFHRGPAHVRAAMAFAALQAERLPPMTGRERFHAALLASNARTQQMADRVQQMIAAARPALATEPRQVVADLAPQLRQVEQDTVVVMDRIRMQLREAAEHQEASIRQTELELAQMQSQLHQGAAAAEQLDRRIEELQQRLEHSAVSDQQLEAALQRTEKAIENRDSNGYLNGIIVIAVCIAGCAVVTTALAGTGIFAAPAASGGAKIGVVIAL